VVTSASFAAAAAGSSFESLGQHHLRGVSEPQEVFAPIASERKENQANHKGAKTQS